MKSARDTLENPIKQRPQTLGSHTYQQRDVRCQNRVVQGEISWQIRPEDDVPDGFERQGTVVVEAGFCVRQQLPEHENEVGKFERISAACNLLENVRADFLELQLFFTA